MEVLDVAAALVELRPPARDEAVGARYVSCFSGSKTPGHVVRSDAPRLGNSRHLFVQGHQSHVQLLGDCRVLTVAGGTVGTVHEIQGRDGSDFVLEAEQLSLCGALQLQRLLGAQRSATLVARKDVTELTPPQDGGDPLRVAFKQRLCLLTVFRRQVEKSNDVRIDDDHGWAASGHSFHTAEIYVFGANEQLLGTAFHDRCDKVFIATKCGPIADPVTKLPGGYDGSETNARRAVENSLRYLRTDHIDVYCLHRKDRATQIEESVEAMAKLVEDGKVRLLISCSIARAVG